MDLYLINAAKDAKRQPCLNMTEASIWDLSEAIIQLGIGEKNREKISREKH